MRTALGRSGIPLAALLAVSAGCAGSRPLKPQGPGNVAVEFSMPGYLTRLGDVVAPIPDPNIGLRVGASDSIDVYAALQPAAFALGIWSTETGLTWHGPPADGALPRLHVGGAVHTMVRPESVDDEWFRGAAEAQVYAHWEPFQHLHPYLIASAGLVFVDPEPVIGAGVGLSIPFSDRGTAALEVLWRGLNLRPEDYSQAYIGIGGYGVIVTSFAIRYAFMGAKKGETR